jgi:hypothetical protein
MSGLEEGARLRSELDTIGSALDLLDVDIKQAESELLAAKARDFRDQAAQKRIELETLNAKTAGLLVELSKLESVEYSHSILSSMPTPGSWLEWGTVTPPKEWMGIPEMQLAIPGRDQKIQIPLSRRLRMQIEEFQREAERIEHRLRPSQPALAAT